MSGIEHLLAVADAYCRAERIELSTASWRSLGDTKKLDALKAGKDIQVRRLEKALIWFAENWPPIGVWPCDVPRPASPGPAVGSIGAGAAA